MVFIAFEYLPNFYKFKISFFHILYQFWIFMFFQQTNKPFLLFFYYALTKNVCKNIIKVMPKKTTMNA
jgi:hypothetical protein